jgi:RHS repeat-associated protein
VNDTTGEATVFEIADAANAGGNTPYTIQSGDQLYFRQLQNTIARGGIMLGFSDASNSNWVVADQDGQTLNSDNTQGSWHTRKVILTSFAGKTLQHVLLDADINSGAGTWDLFIGNLVIVSADGSVHPMFTNQPSASLTWYWSSSSNVSSKLGEVYHESNIATVAWSTTTYYHGDHLGTSRLLTDGNGYPIWQGTFLPYGQEWNAQTTTNHYKFTGKERDSETGLDYFGARYYGSTMGRFLSPDPDDDSGIEKDPQSWNRYAYARNNPLLLTDPTGESYQVCQKDANGKDSNCATISDADFDKLSHSSKDIQYNNNGTVTATNQDGSKTVLGSYRQIDVDLPGDPEANRQAAAMIVKTFDSAMREFGKNALYSATGAVLVRGIGAAIESVRAVQAVENIPLTTHAAARMAQRGITQQAVDYAVESAGRVGNVATQTGKYGTTQQVFTGTNGITAAVETEGRNAGKVVSVWWTGSKP